MDSTLPRTDKIALGYLPVYRELAAAIGPAGRVLELGVQHGESLRLWQRLFPDGLVAGADNDADGRATWPSGTHELRFSQSAPLLATAARRLSPGGYDLIVDDACHRGTETAAAHRNLWPLVRPGRWYVIEDWYVAYEERWHGIYDGDSMLRVAESFLPMLTPDGEIDEIRYRYGLIIVHKRET